MQEDGSVSLEVVNTGKTAGDALVQIYVRCDSPWAPLHPRLCGFKRVSLEPGERKAVSVPLDPLTDTVVTDEGAFEKVLHYTLYAGLSQPDEQSVSLAGAKTVEIIK